MFEKEGILVSIIIMILPVVFLFLLSKVFPFWLDDDPAVQKQSVA
jgi:hypothetical protein